VADYPQSGEGEAQAAIEAARAAQGGWGAQTAVARGRVLSKMSEVLAGRKNELAELLTREEGKTLAESQGEVQRAIDIFRFFGGLSYTLGGQTIPHDLPGNLLYTTREPLGVVGLITPWNFPIAIPAWKMAPALVAGNAVVIKPASQAPALTVELAKAAAEAGLPKGSFERGDRRWPRGRWRTGAQSTCRRGFLHGIAFGRECCLQTTRRTYGARANGDGR
jgi:acyl-CoA reductase-like NAD-dependent aldehyde dehydrogenase